MAARREQVPKLCITSPWNYPLFNPNCQSHFGGWEVRIALIAKELARRRNFCVNLIVGDHGQPHVENRDGVTLYTWLGRTIWGIPVPDSGPSGSTRKSSLAGTVGRKVSALLTSLKGNFFQPIPLSGRVGPYAISPQMVSIYDEVGADIYMVPGNSQFSAEVAFYCRQRGKQFVFLSGSDFDYFPEYKLYPDQNDMYGVPHALKTYAIETAAVHIVQNERQAALLKEGYGRSSKIIRNPIDTEPLFPPKADARTLLWVGKSDERIKRPLLLLDLARSLPEFEFMVIMNPAVQDIHDECVRRAKELPNVTLLERVPFALIESYFANARLHLNTSLFEGFPNTFLQAAKYGVPTISLQVDPGGMLSHHGCGLVCEGDFAKLEAGTRHLMNDRALRDQMGQRALHYVRAHHDKDVIIPKYEQVLNSVLDSRRR